MNWPDERYVRLYTRNTAAWNSWRWEGRALWPLLIRAADRAGVIGTDGLGVRGVAAAVSLPMEVVQPGLAELLLDGCVREHPLGYVIPNYIEAQEGGRSSKERMAKSRAKRRDLERAQQAVSCDETQLHRYESQLNRDESQQSVAPLVRHGTARSSSSTLALDLDSGAANKPPKKAPEKKRKPPRSAGPLKITLSTDWQPKPQHAERATKLGLDLEHCADAMRAWATANGTKLVDWDARFDQWLLNQTKFGERVARQRSSNGRSVPHTLDEYEKDKGLAS